MPIIRAYYYMPIIRAYYYMPIEWLYYNMLIVRAYYYMLIVRAYYYMLINSKSILLYAWYASFLMEIAMFALSVSTCKIFENQM